LDDKQNDQEIINVIDGARKYVYFAIYEFTKDNIAQALIAAKERELMLKVLPIEIMRQALLKRRL